MTWKFSLLTAHYPTWGIAPGAVWAQGQQPRFQGKNTQKEHQGPARHQKQKETPHSIQATGPAHWQGPVLVSVTFPEQRHTWPWHRSDAAIAHELIFKGRGCSSSRGCFWPAEPKGKSPRAPQTTEGGCKGGQAPPHLPRSPQRGWASPHPAVRAWGQRAHPEGDFIVNHNEVVFFHSSVPIATKRGDSNLRYKRRREKWHGLGFGGFSGEGRGCFCSCWRPPARRAASTTTRPRARRTTSPNTSQQARGQKSQAQESLAGALLRLSRPLLALPHRSWWTQGCSNAARQRAGPHAVVLGQGSPELTGVRCRRVCHLYQATGHRLRPCSHEEDA